MAFIGRLGHIFHAHGHGRVERDGNQRVTKDSKHDGRSSRKKKDALLADLQKEKMLRVEAETKLQEMTLQSEDSKARLQALEGEFKQMEDMVQNMLQYKNKLDQIRQEKANLTFTYEEQLQRYQSQICNLEQENMLLMNEVGKLEIQVDERKAEDERYSMSLVRLRNMESENSQLVLENEQQRQQYEKSLGDIANQVVQALLTQKGLREECLKLQKRVSDLEHQNQQLNFCLQHRRYVSPDSFVHSPTGPLGWPYQLNNDVGLTLPPSQYSHLQIRNNLLKQKLSCRSPTGSSGNEATNTNSPTGDENFNENGCFDTPCMPTMSTPPPWLRDRIKRLPVKTDLKNCQGHIAGSITCGTPNVGNSPTEPESAFLSSSQIGAHYKLDPSPNLSPNYAKPWSQKVLNNINNCHAIEHNTKEHSVPQSLAKEAKYEILYGPKSNETKAHNLSWNIHGANNSIDNAQTSVHISIPDTSHNSMLRDTSPGRELLNLSDSFDMKFTINDNDGMPVVLGSGENRARDSDESSDNETYQSISTGLSGACSSNGSSVSLNDILENGLDHLHTPSDDNISFNSFHDLFYNSQLKKSKGSSSSKGSLSKLEEKCEEIRLKNVTHKEHGSFNKPVDSSSNSVYFATTNLNVYNAECKDRLHSLCRPKSLEVIPCGEEDQYAIKRIQHCDNGFLTPVASLLEKHDHNNTQAGKCVAHTLPAHMFGSKFLKKNSKMQNDKSGSNDKCVSLPMSVVCDGVKSPSCKKTIPDSIENSNGSNKNDLSIENVEKLTEVQQSKPKPLQFTESIQMHVVTESVKIPIAKPNFLKNRNSSCSSPGSELDRSVSADDGYSTMASDVNPEVLERFSEGVKNIALTIHENCETENHNTVRPFKKCSNEPHERGSIERGSIGSVKDILEYFEAQLLLQRSNISCSTMSLPVKSSTPKFGKTGFASGKCGSVDISKSWELRRNSSMDDNINKSPICCSLCKHKRPRMFSRNNNDSVNGFNLVQSEALLYLSVSQNFSSDEIMKRAFSDSNLFNPYFGKNSSLSLSPSELELTDILLPKPSSVSNTPVENEFRLIEEKRKGNQDFVCTKKSKEHKYAYHSGKNSNVSMSPSMNSNKKNKIPPPVPKKPFSRKKLNNSDHDRNSQKTSTPKPLEPCKTSEKPMVPVRTSSLAQDLSSRVPVRCKKSLPAIPSQVGEKLSLGRDSARKIGDRKNQGLLSTSELTKISSKLCKKENPYVNVVNVQTTGVRRSQSPCCDFAPSFVGEYVNEFEGEYTNLIGNTCHQPSSWSLEGHTGNKSSTELLDRSFEDIEEFLSAGEDLLNPNSTIFNNDYYSLCKVESRRSLDSNSTTSTPALKRKISEARTNSEPNCSVVGLDDDDLKQQIVSLSRTVDHLQQSLTSLDEVDIDVDPVPDIREFSISTPKYSRPAAPEGLEKAIKDSICTVYPDFRLSNLSISTCSSVSGGQTCDSKAHDSDSECSEKYHWMDDDIQPLTEGTDGELDATDEFDWLKMEGFGMEMDVDQCVELQTTIEVAGELSAELDVTDAKIRAEILDSLIEDCSDDDGNQILDDENFLDYSKMPKKRKKVGRKGLFNVVRHAVHSRPAINDKTFLRFEEEEQRALSYFDFLRLYPANTEEETNKEKENTNIGHINVIEPIVVIHTSPTHQVNPIRAQISPTEQRTSTFTQSKKSTHAAIENIPVDTNKLTPPTGGTRLDRSHSEKHRRVSSRSKNALSKQKSLPDRPDDMPSSSFPGHRVHFQDYSLNSPSAQCNVYYAEGNIPEEKSTSSSSPSKSSSLPSPSVHDSQGSITGETRLRVSITELSSCQSDDVTSPIKTPEQQPKSRLPEPVSLRTQDDGKRTEEKSRSLEVSPPSPKRTASLKSRSLDKGEVRKGSGSPTMVRTVLTPSSPPSPEHRSLNRSGAKVKLGVQAKYDHTRRRASGPAHLVSPGETELRISPIASRSHSVKEYSSNVSSSTVSVSSSAKSKSVASSNKSPTETSRIPTSSAGNRSKKNSGTSLKIANVDSKTSAGRVSSSISASKSSGSAKPVKETKLWAPARTKAMLGRTDRSLSLDSATPVDIVRKSAQILPPKQKIISKKGVKKDKVLHGKDNNNDAMSASTGSSVG